MNKPRGTVWYRSLAVQLGAALLLLFGTAVWIAGSTLYQINLRKHDYAILDLTGQLRLIAESMSSQSRQFLLRGKASDGALYRANLKQQRDLYERIIDAFERRELDADLTGLDDPLRCTWDAQSKAQLDRTAARWHRFARQLDRLLKDAPEARVAEYVVARQTELATLSSDLNQAFRRMMEGKQELIVVTTRIALGISLILVIVLLTLLYTTFARPLGKTLEGFSRVAQGDLGYQVPLHLDNEIGQMVRAFNHLSCHLRALFSLTDRINQATRLDQSLRIVAEEFRCLLPLDWLGLLTLDASRQHFLLDSLHAEHDGHLHEGDCFEAHRSPLWQALNQGQPLHIPSLAELARDQRHTAFTKALQRDGIQSVLFFPIASHKQWSAVIVFAARETAAYGEEHLELLRNITALVSHSFEKTVVTDNLIVSAVTGLARLAESRDPETGDHLVRMTRYSVLIAEALREHPDYRERISVEFIHDIDRFAAMHDIGKVGVEDHILLKPGRLSDRERDIMQRHPTIGGEVLRRCEEQMNSVGHSIFRVGIEIAECHHEKFDGSGYPKGLSGREIPLSARIVAVADVFDALTSKRPYKEAWPVDKALELVRAERGKHFDPDVVDAMERCLPDMLQVHERLKHV